MARTALSVTTLGPNGPTADPAGVTPDASNMNSITPPRRSDLLFIRVKNADSGPHTCTIPAGPYPLCDSGVADLVVTVAAGATKWIGPLSSSRYIQKDGTINLNWDASTSITVTPFALSDDA